MATDTHRAEVVPIVLEKHPDADSLSVVNVWNFTCVVRTEDWIGIDKAVYVQPDSIMPDLPGYRFLKDTQGCRKEREDLLTQFNAGSITQDQYNAMLAEVEKKVDGNTKYLRVTARRLRGIWSMGMLLPAPAGAEIGDDVAEQMGITHYEPPPEPEPTISNRHKGSDVGPAPPVLMAPTYDVKSAYRYAAECFEPGELVYVTEKINGQNSRHVATDNGNSPYTETSPAGLVRSCIDVTLYAGSHEEWKLKEGGSNWWRVLEQNPWISEWCYNNQDALLYGEIFGWVQKDRYGAKIPGTLFYRAFDILKGSSWLDAEAFMTFLSPEQRVPCLGIMPYNFAELVKLAEGPSLIPGASNAREGIVIRPIKERYHRRVGRVILKIVSNAYLERSSR
jgi:RNA ligase (TIGR02306 family)